MVLGNLIQINARGQQEQILYGNPKMTYFKKVFNSPSNFARSYHNIPYSGTARFGNKIHINIPLNGDLLANLFLSLELPKIDEINSGAVQNLNNEKGISYYCNGIGYKLIKSIELKFNGVSIEKLTGEMCAHIFNYQFMEYDNNLINHVFKLKEYVDYSIVYGSDTIHNIQDYERRGPINLRLPIPFFFSQSPDNYLPLCAMSNTNIEVILEIENIDNLIIGNNLGNISGGNEVNMNNIPSINNFRIINEVINE